MSDVYLRSVAVMDTVLTIQVVGHGDSPAEREERSARVDGAIEWFSRIEAACSRFDERSEVSRLAAAAGTAVPVSEMLFEAVRFALAVADESAGAFDPTIGYRMAARGFNREYRTGNTVNVPERMPDVSYRDVQLDADARTITLLRPLMLDLGAVAKGLAVDMAAQELAPLQDFAVDAGGDQYFAGDNPRGELWSVGIRHPRIETELIDTFRISGAAVCTSGDYARRSAVEDSDLKEHHILDPRSGRPAPGLASVTVVAPTALVADALATAAFVLGPVEGVPLLERHGVDGLLVTPTLERRVARGPRTLFRP